MKVTIKNIASFKEEPQTLHLKESIGLAYGLNGTGKTVLSNFIYSIANSATTELSSLYQDCDTKDLDDSKLYVFNQRFIEDNFLNNDMQKAIFTLGSINVNIKRKIDKIDNKIKRISLRREEEEASLVGVRTRKAEVEKDLEDKVWGHKNTLLRDKTIEKLLIKGFQTKALYLKKIKSTPLLDIGNTNTNILKGSISPEEAVRRTGVYLTTSLERLPSIDIQLEEKNQLRIIEQDSLLLGSHTSTRISNIKKLVDSNGNLNWIKDGLEYLDQACSSPSCPFCSQGISQKILDDIKSLFDDSYHDLEKLKDTYVVCQDTLIKRIQGLLEKENSYKALEACHQLFMDIKKEAECIEILLQKNLKEIDTKLADMSHVCKFEALDFEPLEKQIRFLKTAVNTFNSRIENPTDLENELKLSYWHSLRRHFDDYIVAWQKENENLEKQIYRSTRVLKIRQKGQDKFEKSKKALVGQQTDTSQAVSNINDIIKSWSLSGFEITEIKTQNDDSTELTQYQLTRGNPNEKVFQTLSEGEKSIISFLYFVEQSCENSEAADKGKIAVIDDPISSLSSQHIFNISYLIKNKFIANSSFHKVLILTHSLYFYDEICRLIPKNKDWENKVQWFRISKSKNSSKINPARENEISGSYREFWRVVESDENSFAAANAMRHILEHFFGFIGSPKTYRNTLDKLLKKDAQEFAPFYRYINSGSHSDSTNTDLMDLKEFDIEQIKGQFKEIFKKAGHIEHYASMMKEIKRKS